jgi:crotonobetainyl-CoA:carnitine CoA-transferase CaiB-like acyl-CoA transferase
VIEVAAWTFVPAAGTGEHAEQVLRELGLMWAEIADLTSQEVIT